MPGPRPNILHILTDQQRFDTIAALGNTIIRTPNLDRLVGEGTTFSRAYSPSPECVPARAALITGRYPGRNCCYSNVETMPESAPTFMDRLTEAGYRTHGVGKCHFTPNPAALRGFQTRRSQEELPVSREADDYSRWLDSTGWKGIIEPHGSRSEMYYVPQASLLPEAAHPSHWVADEAVGFLEADGNGPEPWYLYTSFVHPHPPFCPPSPWHKLYRPREMPQPLHLDRPDDLIFFINRQQNRYKYRDRGFDLNLVRCMRAYYYSCISFVDAQIGRILRQLEISGQLDDTLILFTTDHGEYLGDYGCFGKRGMHDVSARIPLLVRWPGGRDAATTCSTPASLVNLAPTFLNAAGVEYAESEMDGQPLQKLLAGQTGREHVFSQYHRAGNGLYLMAGTRFKYVYSAPDQREYLFDALTDPGENANLKDQPEQAAVLKLMRQQCQAWVRQTQPEEIVDGRWKVYPVREMPADPDAGTIVQDPVWWRP